MGGRLVRDLMSDKKRVRVFVRDAKKIQGQSWAHEVEIIEVRILIRNITEAKIILRLGHTPQIAVRRPMLIIIAICQADRWMFRYDVF